MSDFLATTPFQLIRRLAAAGGDSSSVYLLISENSAMETVQADVAAEVEVQIGGDFRSLAASGVRPEGLDVVFGDTNRPVVLLTLDRWLPKLIDSLDRNIVLVTRARALLLLANQGSAERILAAAPNLRNRFADVLAIEPDEAFGGVRA